MPRHETILYHLEQQELHRPGLEAEGVSSMTWLRNAQVTRSTAHARQVTLIVPEGMDETRRV